MIYSVKDAEIYYEIIGEGKPIVILHGCSIDHRAMKGCMEPVFHKYSGYKRIYIDLPGMGKSNAPKWVNSSDGLIELLISCIEKIIPNEPFLFAGESYGGYLSRVIATKMPHRIHGLLLICPVIIAEHEKRTVPDYHLINSDDLFLNSLPVEERREFCEFAVIANEYTYHRYKEEIKPGLSAANIEFIENLQKNYSSNFPIKEQKYVNPVLVLAGRQDIVVGYKDILDVVEDYPRATFAILDMAGHNLQIEQPQLFESLVKEWLVRVSREEVN
ncbi:MULTISPECIES: alpha/beta fold hydrolase [unclassified Bacillus cereus group]|uniref:alpha/beta fold hydrolase n=1 Tax=unclassified Bacillus cereus group TaxID=2750818 RepID=UPI001F55BF20|nr:MULTISPECIES: alpha/beta hydrolase [unclassified Bacillus cereus group]